MSRYFNSNELREYVSGADDIVIAALTYSLEKEWDCTSERVSNDTPEYTNTVGHMYRIVQKEYKERGLDWRLYDAEESPLYLAIQKEDAQ